MPNYIFEGINQVPFYYSRFGWTRNNGKTWHGGIDIVPLTVSGAVRTDAVIRMPWYHSKDKNGNVTVKSISGKVIRSRIVTNKSDKTWEWGNYICIQLDANQTPDNVNFIYLCHNSKNLVPVGKKVKSGDPLAVVGNTGNAALASPPILHVHMECRATATGSGLDPTAYAGFPNIVGVYGTEDIPKNEAVTYKIGPMSGGDAKTIKELAEKLKLPISQV